MRWGDGSGACLQFRPLRHPSCDQSRTPAPPHWVASVLLGWCLPQGKSKSALVGGVIIGTRAGRVRCPSCAPPPNVSRRTTVSTPSRFRHRIGSYKIPASSHVDAASSLLVEITYGKPGLRCRHGCRGHGQRPRTRPPLLMACTRQRSLLLAARQLHATSGQGRHGLYNVVCLSTPVAQGAEVQSMSQSISHCAHSRLSKAHPPLGTSALICRIRWVMRGVHQRLRMFRVRHSAPGPVSAGHLDA